MARGKRASYAKEVKALTSSLAILGIKPLEVWLFGSRATGLERPDSDIDLCVIVPNDTRDIPSVAANLNGQLGLGGFNVDIVVVTAKRFQNDACSPLLHEIRSNGVRLLARAA